jgi:hypothetical protein
MIKKFTLGAVEWTVKVDNDKLDDRECYGLTIFDESKIFIQDETLKIKRSDGGIELTLYHEVVHAILDTLGEKDLSHDEKFVKKFSMLLHQFEKTKE